MTRFAPYLGAVAALLFGIFLSTLFPSTTYTLPQVPRQGFATTTASFPALPVPSLSSVGASSSVPEVFSARAASTPKTAKTSPMPSPAPKQETTAATPAPAQEAMPSSGSADLDTAAQALRNALVNILCYAPAGSGLHSISGSGVFIDSKGYILTNAHVALYFLLADHGVSCTVRTGNPATDAYKAKLAYISPTWIADNAAVITESSPSGTGEHDFAVLAVTGSATNAPLPSAFPFVPLAQLPPARGEAVVIATYGAQFLESNTIQSSLFPTVVSGSVKDLYTFGTNTADVIALGGSAAAQEGSSGGGITGAAATLLGTITTSTVDGPTDTRSLDAITASYVRAEYANETGSPFDFLLDRAPSTSVHLFADEASSLEATLLAALPS